VSLRSKCRLPEWEARQGLFLSRTGRPGFGHAAARSRSRRKRTLLSFQRPGRHRDVKKAPTHARGLETVEQMGSGCFSRRSVVVVCRDFPTPPAWAAGR